MIAIHSLVIATAFLTPISFDSGRLWMLLPLTLAVSIVYKTLKLDNLKALPIAAGLLWITILAGMIGVAVAIYILIWLFI